MMGHPGHRDALAFGDGAGGQHEVQFAGGNFGVGVKRFVEVAQAEEEQRVGVLGFQLKVLFS
jgi:hypothetical protein